MEQVCSRHQLCTFHPLQFPGLGFLATKPELAKLSAQLKFLPRGFQLPDEYEAWQEFIKTERGAKMEWLQKGRNHRCVPWHASEGGRGFGP